jgi:dienelactone hydrolase
MKTGALLWIVLAAGLVRAADLPVVVLLGEAERPAYADTVAKSLQGRALVIVPEPGAEGRIAVAKAAVIHYQPSLQTLNDAARLKTAVEKLRATGAVRLVVAAAGAVAEPALQAMFDADVPVLDLRAVQGAQAVGDSVTDCMVRQLTIAAYKPLPVPASGPDAARTYRENEARRDALVPEFYKRMKVGEFAVPGSSADWKTRRPSVLKSVVASLGELPPRPSPIRPRLVSVELHRTYRLEKVRLDNGVEGDVSALLLIPNRVRHPAPAILWLHSSTPDHTQVVIPGTNGGPEPLGEVLVGLGYVVLSPDSYWHGDRAGTGPAGKAESRAEEEDSLFKLHLWMGRTLWGMFVRDDQIALDYLASRPEVDRKRIGTTGMSMGSTRAWWLAAVDDRIAAAVGVACFTRYQNLIAHGQLAQHGVYYFTDGLLKDFDSEGVLALIAPRPFLALTGELDAGSPADGIRVLEDRLSRTYASLGAGDRFKSIVYPDLGHTYTPAMRAEMLSWFSRWLKPGAADSR